MLGFPRWNCAVQGRTPLSRRHRVRFGLCKRAWSLSAELPREAFQQRLLPCRKKPKQTNKTKPTFSCITDPFGASRGSTPEAAPAPGVHKASPEGRGAAGREEPGRVPCQFWEPGRVPCQFWEPGHAACQLWVLGHVAYRALGAGACRMPALGAGTCPMPALGARTCRMPCFECHLLAPSAGISGNAGTSLPGERPGFPCAVPG